MKKILLLILLLVAAATLLVGGYVAYVYLTYDRIEDNQKLEIESVGAPCKEVMKTGTEYTAGTYNIGFGAYTPDYSFFLDGGEYSRCISEEAASENVKGAADVAIARKPDLMMFEEVDREATRSYYVNQDEIVDGVFDGYYKSFAVNYDSAYLMYPLDEPIGRSLSGISLYSRFPIKSSVRRSLPISTEFDKFFDLDRCYSKSVIPVSNGKDLCVFTAHLSAYNESAEIREGQVDMLIEDMNQEYEAGNYVICGGDFNHDLTLMDENADGKYGWTYPFPRSKFPKGISFAMDSMSKAQRDALAPTERNTDAPYDEKKTETFMLDGFIISDNVEMTSYIIGSTGYLYSDHDPVFMKFKLK